MRLFPKSDPHIKPVTMLGIVIVVFFISYSDAIVSLLKIWWERSDYSHGFLIPVISLYFIWLIQDKLKNIPVCPNVFGGLIVLLAGDFMFVMGSVSSTEVIKVTAIVLLIPGLVLMLLGYQYLKALAFPLTYLILMVPVFDLVIDKIHQPLQVLSAIIGTKLLALFNIPALQHAQFIELPNITLEVATECSGIHFLVSIIAIGLPLAYLTQKRWHLRFTLIVSAVIIGILANGLRVSLIGVWSYYGGQDIHGPGHILHGFFVSMIGFISLFIMTWLLSRFSSQANVTTAHITASPPQRNDNNNALWQFSNTRLLYSSGLLAILVMLLSGIYSYSYIPKQVPIKKDLQDIPLAIGEWVGQNVSYPQDFPRVNGADAEVSRTYKNKRGDEVWVYVGYFTSQRQEKKLVSYTLHRLYEGEKEIKLPSKADSSGRGIKVAQSFSHNTSVIYWYDIDGHIIANRYIAKIVTSINALVKRQTNGAIIMVASNRSGANESPIMTEFAEQLMPLLQLYVP